MTERDYGWHMVAARMTEKRKKKKKTVPKETEKKKYAEG
jgi:hypothetical protein